jgi:hypothetical protein
MARRNSLRRGASLDSRAAFHRGRRLLLEPLQDRRLLSGVTLITHGFGADVSDWVSAMRNAIAARTNTDPISYVLKATDG